MSDNEIDLSRRKALLGIGTIGVATAGAGAGTFAYFSDTESSSGNTVSAGTLNLTADGNDGTATTTLNASNLAPGESGSGSTELINDGTIDGYLNFALGPITNHENSVEEPEQGAQGENGGSPGELGSVLDVTVGFDSDQDGTIDTVVLDSTDRDSRQSIDAVTGIEYNPNEAIGSGDSVDFVVEYELPSSAGNAVQGDGVEFDVTFELLQQSAGPSVALTGDSAWAEQWTPTTEEAHTGDGSWKSAQGSGKQILYFGGQFSSFHDLPQFTVEEIDEISYWLQEPSDLEGVDVYLGIYTEPENDGNDGSSWYDSRLQALPAESNQGSPNFTPDAWNEFSTNGGATNTLTFADTGHGPNNFNQPLPSLSDLQSGQIDWNNWGANYSGTHDYRNQTVKALSLQTGSQASSGLVAYVDDVSVSLTTGETFTIDLES